MWSDDGLNLNKSICLQIDEQVESNCLELLIESVRMIAQSYPAPYNLFVSGGVDSQAMLYVWLKSGIPFNAIHVDYMGMNDHDVMECKLFCAIHSISFSTIQFDLINFLENDLDRYARTYRCASPQICTHMAFSELADGTKVFAGNLPFDERVFIDNTIFGLQRYATLSKQSIVPFFLSISEEAVISSITTNCIARKTGLSYYEQKCHHYRSIGIPVIPQTGKLTGFEVVKNLYDKSANRVTPRMRLSHSTLPSKRVFDQLFRNKYLIEFQNHYSPTFLVTSTKVKNEIPD